MRKSAPRLRIVGITISVALIVFAGGCGKNKEETSGLPAVKVNALAPNFTLDYHGAPGQLSLSDLRGKVVMVNFWASWCPPCRSELPDIVSLYNEYKGQGFEVLGVIVNSKPEDVDQIIREFKIPYRSVVGNDGISQIWQVSAIPTTYMIDRNGIIRAQYIGARSRTTFERDVVRLLAD